MGLPEYKWDRRWSFTALYLVITVVVLSMQASSIVFGGRLPLALLMGLSWFFMLRVGRAASPLQLGKSRAKVYDLNQEGAVTFADVAGVEEAKRALQEVVRFLRQPQQYQDLGA